MSPGTAVTGPKPCSVLLADDHAVVRAGVRAALEAAGGFDIVAEAANGIEAITLARMHQPDLLILDIAMPFGSGLEIVEEIRRWCPDTRIILLTGLTSRGMLRFAQGMGIDALFLKSDPVSSWLPLLDAPTRGSMTLSPSAAALLDQAEKTGAGPAELSRREQQVLMAIARGEANSGIAERLGIAAKTVDKHRTGLMRKLGVHSVAELLAVALREGLLDSARHV